MDYLRKKYEGYSSVLTSSLEDELLLSPGEYLLMKKEVATALNKKSCPQEISFDLFNDMIDLHL